MNNNFNNLQSGIALKCDAKKRKSTTACHDVLRIVGLKTVTAYSSLACMSLVVQYTVPK